MATKIIHKAPWPNPFYLSRQAIAIAWILRRDADDIEDWIEETKWGKWMKKLDIWWSAKSKWDAIPDKIHVEEHSVWNMDVTLAHSIHAHLVKLKEVKNGAFPTDIEDGPDDLVPDPENDSDDDPNVDPLYFARCNWILDEIIWAFYNETLDESDIEGAHTGKVDYRFEKDPENENLSIMVKGPNHTFKRNEKLIKEWQDRKDRGRYFFAKYYNGFWT